MRHSMIYVQGHEFPAYIISFVRNYVKMAPLPPPLLAPPIPMALKIVMCLNRRNSSEFRAWGFKIYETVVLD